MTDREALTTAMYDAEDNRCSGYPGGCCAPTTHGSAIGVLAALADAGYVIVKAEDAGLRAALERIVALDYRGHPSLAQTIARAALEPKP